MIVITFLDTLRSQTTPTCKKISLEQAVCDHVKLIVHNFLHFSLILIVFFTKSDNFFRGRGSFLNPRRKTNLRKTNCVKMSILTTFCSTNPKKNAEKHRKQRFRAYIFHNLLVIMDNLGTFFYICLVELGWTKGLGKAWICY